MERAIQKPYNARSEDIGHLVSDIIAQQRDYDIIHDAMEEALGSVVRLNSQGVITWVNDGFCSSFGCQKSDVIGIHFSVLITSSCLSAFQLALFGSNNGKKRVGLSLYTAEGVSDACATVVEARSGNESDGHVIFLDNS